MRSTREKVVATASRRERVYKWAEASARREAASRKPTEQRSNYASGIIATIAKFATARSARKASRACFFAEEERKRCTSLQSHSCGCMTAALCATRSAGRCFLAVWRAFERMEGAAAFLDNAVVLARPHVNYACRDEDLSNPVQRMLPKKTPHFMRCFFW